MVDTVTVLFTTTTLIITFAYGVINKPLSGVDTLFLTVCNGLLDPRYPPDIDATSKAGIVSPGVSFQALLCLS